MSRSVSDTVSTAQEDLEKLVNDLRGLLAAKDPNVRAVALRTPTLPPATHTSAYLVGAAAGPQLLVDPGSFVEFLKVIEPLAHPERFGGNPDDGFSVVVPSLIGIPLAMHWRWIVAKLRGNPATAPIGGAR